LTLWGSATLDVGKGDPTSFGKALHCLTEGEVINLLQECDEVATLGAAEAVPHAA